MSEPVEPRRWTGRKWLYAIAAVLAVQVAAVAMLVRRPPAPPVRPTFPTRVHLAVGEDAERRLASMPSVVDPALFALPSLHGFSGEAWLRYPLLQHNPVERVEPPEWLDLRASSLGDEFLALVATNALAPRLLIDAPLPPVLRYDGSYPSEGVAGISRWRVEGPLAGRPLMIGPDLPSWPHSELLSNTVVQAVVDPMGWTFSASVAVRSGLLAADEYALRAVETIRFQPSRGKGGEEFVWGTFVFLWHTRPVPVTNAAVVVP